MIHYFILLIVIGNNIELTKTYLTMGDIIRFVRDTIKDALDEVGLDDLKEEIKDIIEAIKGK